MKVISIAQACQILAAAGASGRTGGRVTAGLRWIALVAVVAMLVPGGAQGEQASDPSSQAAGQLDVGASFSCAIVAGGQVRCWGYGADGELGYPGVTTVGASDTPAAAGRVDIGAGFTATAISSGDYHTCVIRNDGSVICWGYGKDGRLGYGNTNNVGDTETPGSAGPVNLGVGRTAVAISAGGAHTCAILDNGNVLCWGYGFNGALGYGNQNSISDPSAGQPLSAVACAAAGQCTAVDNLGHEVTFNPAAPGTSTRTQVDTATKLNGVACPSVSECTAVDASGREVAFNPAAPSIATPTPIEAGSSLSGVACPSVSQCAAVDGNGGEVTFNPASGAVIFGPAAIDSGHSLNGVACLPSASQCAAVDGNGGEVTFNPTSGAVIFGPAAIDSGNALNGVACLPSASQCTAVDGNGGEVTFNPTSGAVIFGPAAIDSGNALNAVACLSATLCTAVDNLGHEVTFNPANPGPSSPTTIDTVGPVDLGPRTKATAISLGSSHTCAILNDGSVRCWGYGGNGRLGYGDTKNVGDGAPADASVATAGRVNLGAGSTAVAITAGGAQTCAILNDGSVRCWGFGFSGQLGYGNQNDVGNTPTSTAGSAGPVNLGAGRTAVAISTGAAHTCAILDNGSLLCWGYGADGRLGYGNTNTVGDTPADTPGTIGPVNLGPGRTAVAVSAGGKHTCARLADGSVRCWGYGANGRLGYCGTSNVGDAPSSLPGMVGPVNLVPGDGGVLCAPVNASLPSISGRAVAGQTLTEAHGSWSPTPTGYAYQWERCDHAGANCGTIQGASAQNYKLVASDVGSTIRVLETGFNAGTSSLAASSAATALVTAAPAANPDAARERGWRSCLAKVSAAAKHARALTRRGSKRQRARARRRLARRLARGRARCVEIWGRTPGRVTGLRATARGRTKIELDFTAPGTNGRNPPAATSYLVKQSPAPIRNQRELATAPELCNGACRFKVTQIGTKIKLTVTALHPHTTYYYAVAALDNVTARPGPRSPTVKAKTA